MPYKKQIPENPKTLGEHILRKRLQLRLLQKEVAAQVGVTEMAVTNWETGKSVPQIHLYPAIIGFLEYYPFHKDVFNVSGQIEFVRYSNGWSYKRMAKEFEVNMTTVQDWHSNNRIHRTAHKQILATLLRRCLSL